MTPDSTDADTIRPVDFEPPQQAVSERRWRPGPVATATTLCLLLAGGLLWFLFGARSLAILIEPVPERMEILGGFSFQLAGRHLMRPGEYELLAERDGYYPIREPFQVTSAMDQRLELAMQRLPGLLQVESQPSGVDVLSGDQLLGQANGDAIELQAGQQQLVFRAPRHFPLQRTVDIIGMGQLQSESVELRPAWGTYRLDSTPSAATVWLDDTEIGTTPLQFEALEGRHEVVLRRDGHKAHSLQLEARAGETRQLDSVQLDPADATLRLHSSPAGANVTIAGRFEGRTPVEVGVEPGRPLDIRLFKTGYRAWTSSVSLESGERRELNAQLQAQTGKVRVLVSPAEAEVLVGGRSVGRGEQNLQLAAIEQRISARFAGYANAEQRVTPRPGFPQTITLTLLTEEQARWAAVKPVLETGAGQELLLIRPQPFTMGASRREPGRRANENLRDVTLRRAFYLARHEVTNAQFREFRATHSSGNLNGKSLNSRNQPVVNLSWNDAALYCNWLSERDGLPAVYTVTDETVTGFDSDAAGYRLPTEAEWAFVARVAENGESYKFPWGKTWPPGERAGNFADQSAAKYVGQYVEGYRDGEIVSAPVGQYKENWRGFFDLGGNVSEWIHDYYAAGASLGRAADSDPVGPELGEFHVIRDSSYRHGSIVELRLSYRDYGKNPRPDVGFRIARYVE